MRNNYFIEGDIVFVELNRKDGNKYYAKVSLESLPKLLEFDVKWCYVNTGRPTPYVYTKDYSSKEKKNVPLHRFIKDFPEGLVINHKNGDGLDNTLDNLEVVSNRVNCIKKVNLASNNTSGYRGVYWDKYRNKWAVKFRKGGKMYVFGRYKDKEEAARVAEEKRKELFRDVLEKEGVTW